MREMKNSGVEWIGDIPAHWGTIRFKYLHNGLNTGEAIDKEFWSNDTRDTIFYTAGLLPIHTTFTDFPEWKYTNDNDLLLARNGTPYVYYPMANACYTDHIIRATIKENVCRKFLQYGLQQSISSVVVSQVSIATWSASLWNEQTIPWPSLDEQKRIADFIDRICAEIDAVIAGTKATIEEYKALKQSIITEAVTKGIRGDRPMKDSGVKSIGNIPSTFNKYRIKHIAELYGRIGFRGYTTDDLVDEGEGAITLSPSNLRDMMMNYSKLSYLTWEKYDESPEIQINNGDILMVKTGSSYGKTALVDNLPLEATINPQLIVIKSIKVSTKYLLYCFQTPYFLDQVENAVVGGTIPTMAQEKIYNFYVFVPDEQEQNEIVDFLHRECEKLDKLIADKTHLLEEMEQYKKSVIYEYVTGKKEVR